MTTDTPVAGRGHMVGIGSLGTPNSFARQFDFWDVPHWADLAYAFTAPGRVSISTVARITFPERGLGEHADWALLRPEIGAGMGALSSAVYEKSKLDLREREAARWTIALINDCVVCQGTRAKDGDAAGIDEGFYAKVTDWRTCTSIDLTERERLAAEFAFRFALDHQAMDNEFWGRLRATYQDDEIADLTMCCGAWLGMGRMLAVLGVRAPEERLLV